MTRLAACLIAASAIIASFLAWSAEANLRNRRELVTKYPAIKGTRLDNCTTCHALAPPQLNPYGAAWKEARFDFAAIEKADSDGDKFANRAEIDSLTFPGDPKDRPGTRKAPPDSSARDTTLVPAAPDTARKR
jgi:hypothetical protein